MVNKWSMVGRCRPRELQKTPMLEAVNWYMFSLPRPRRTRTLYPPLSYSVVTIFMIVCGGAEAQEYLYCFSILIVRVVVAPHSLQV
jgi:hypothetical protein